MTRQEDPGRGPAPTGDGIYRAIQWLLFLDVVVGLAVAVVGEAVLEVRAIAFAGLGLAVIGLVLMVFFRGLAAREQARRQAADDARHRGLRRAGGE